MEDPKLPRLFRYELRHYLQCGSWNWRYVCEGSKGAVEFWAREARRVINSSDDTKFYGGIETHRTSGEGPPDHGRCSAISERACWHDGSSLLAAEVWIPHWEIDQNDHVAVFRMLAAEYGRRFDGVDA